MCSHNVGQFYIMKPEIISVTSTVCHSMKVSTLMIDTSQKNCIENSFFYQQQLQKLNTYHFLGHLEGDSQEGYAERFSTFKIVDICNRTSK